MDMRFSSPHRAICVIWASTALATACGHGGQSGDLNEDALGRSNGEPRDRDAGNEPTPDEPSSNGRDEDDDAPPEPEPDEPEPNPEPETSAPVLTPGSNATTTPGAPTLAPGPAMSAPMSSVQPGPFPSPVMTTPAPSSQPPVMVPIDDACANLAYDTLVVDAEELGFPGVNSVEFYGDGATSVCVEPSAGRLCVSGIAVDSGDDYSRWGAGVALVVEPSAGAALDLASLDVTAVGFELSEISGRAVRVGLQQVDDSAIADPLANFSANSFYWGGSSAVESTEDTTYTVAFSQFTLPAWTLVVDPDTGSPAENRPIDAAELSSLHFEVYNNANSLTEPYHFCVSQVAWRHADGTDAVLPVAPSSDAGVE